MKNKDFKNEMDNLIKQSKKLTQEIKDNMQQSGSIGCLDDNLIYDLIRLKEEFHELISAFQHATDNYKYVES